MRREKSVIIRIGVISFTIILLICGLFWFWLGGSMNFFGEQGFHGELSFFISGVVGGGFIFAPCITAIVYRLYKYKKASNIMFLCAVICWILFFIVFPLLDRLTDKIHDSAPPEKIAQRAIHRTDKDLEKGEIQSSDVYAERVGNRLWIYEGTTSRLEPSKEKAVVEKAAQMVFDKSKGEISPSFSSYGWRSIYYDSEINYYGMVLFYEDGSYVIMYDMEKDRWRETGEADPPRNEGTRNARF